MGQRRAPHARIAIRDAGGCVATEWGRRVASPGRLMASRGEIGQVAAARWGSRCVDGLRSSDTHCVLGAAATAVAAATTTATSMASRRHSHTHSSPHTFGLETLTDTLKFYCCFLFCFCFCFGCASFHGIGHCLGIIYLFYFFGFVLFGRRGVCSFSYSFFSCYFFA